MPNIKIDTSKLVLLPVPKGLVMRYRHFYVPATNAEVQEVDGQEVIVGPKRLDRTVAWLEDEAGNRVCEADALVNPRDTPIKKLGRAIAHNRCIKQWEYDHARHYNVPRELPGVA